jgi:predicted GIY-YIG superfamily endonuclease
MAIRMRVRILLQAEALAKDVTSSAFASPKFRFAKRRRASSSPSARLRRDKSAYMFYIYSLKCKDGYYVGCTEDIADRVVRHQKGQVSATANRLPISLEFYFAVEDKYIAFQFEKYLKSGSGRAFVKQHFSDKK